jgi:flavin-dependent dehydrogenase
MVGDAAGVDPLFAEGISYAMEYGSIAAEVIAEGFKRDDLSFTGYRERLLDHRLGKLLLRRAAVARSLYRHRYPPAWSLLWMLADIAPKRVQRAMGASLALLPP